MADERHEVLHDACGDQDPPSVNVSAKPRREAPQAVALCLECIGALSRPTAAHNSSPARKQKAAQNASAIKNTAAFVRQTRRAIRRGGVLPASNIKNMDMTTFDTLMTRLALWSTAASIAGFLITMYALYLVIRAAIRDGINDSALIRTARPPIPAPQLGDTIPTPLPEIRADR